MVKVAIAGGSGGIGRAIVDALKEQTEHQFIILTRKVNPELESALGVKTVAIDYTNISAIQKALEEHQVHTIISALSVNDQKTNDAQINLIRAAAASSTTKRFTPSEFGTFYKEDDIKSLPLVAFKFAAIAELEKTDLEFTLFSNGFFLDYFGLPKVQSHLKPFTIGIDFQNKVAGLPGTGNTPVVFTRTKDVGRLVVASLGLPKWKRRSILIGDRKSWNEILNIAEKVTGSKFEVHHDSIATLKNGQITELPSHVPMYPFLPKEHLQGFLSVFGIWSERGDFDLDVTQGDNLNQLFPEITTTSIEDIIKEAWA
ncbi:hypothetical protein PVAG01_08492 [Phlyctema vagabunda]|uniref:NmrA-like domain-containing protein n=1 Tax=Phlyctema vagabunda TaxID=108571 RepID=A0ABR4P9L7_9HELO